MPNQIRRNGSGIRATGAATDSSRLLQIGDVLNSRLHLGGSRKTGGGAKVVVDKWRQTGAGQVAIDRCQTGAGQVPDRCHAGAGHAGTEPVPDRYSCVQ